MKVDFLEAAKGVEKEMSFHIMDSCPTCSGSGNEPGTSADRYILMEMDFKIVHIFFFFQFYI